MTWLIWRQQRRQAFVATIALGAGALTLVVTGFGMLATYHSALRTCAAGLGGAATSTARSSRVATTAFSTWSTPSGSCSQ